MDYFLAFLLGIIQGLSEFLPISSSAHLILFREWLGFESIDDLSFDVALHLGTALALVCYFHNEVRRLALGLWNSLRKPNLRSSLEQRMPWYILAGTVPAAVIGALLEDVIEHAFRNPPVIVVTLVAGAVLFLAIERITTQTAGMDQINLRRSLVIGIAQSIALIPGVSRSGITIIAGMSQNLKRAEAARFSFLLSIPIVIGAGGKKLIELKDLAVTPGDAGVLVTGTLTAAVVGWLVIRFLLRYLQYHKLDLFAYYRLILAAVIVIWMLSG